MARCPHTGLSIPECSCRPCLLELFRAHAPAPIVTLAEQAMRGAELPLRANRGGVR